jgi:hypothetical protein
MAHDGCACAIDWKLVAMDKAYMLDLSKEAPISLSKAARLPEYTRDGRHSSPVTVWRHIRRGCLCAGKRVFLESTVQGGRRVTTREAVKRFMERLTLNAPGAPLPSVAKDAHRGAARRLQLAGL